MLQKVWRGYTTRKRVRAVKAILDEFNTNRTLFYLAHEVLALRQEKERQENNQDCSDYNDSDFGPMTSLAPAPLYPIDHWAPGPLSLCGVEPYYPDLHDLPDTLNLYSDGGPEAAKEHFDRICEEVAQLTEEVATAKTELASESKKLFNKGGVSSARYRLTDAERRLHALQEMLPSSEDFQQFDADHNGQLDREELKALFNYLDPDCWTDEQLDRLFDAVDQNSNGQIEFNEFLNWVDPSLRPPPSLRPGLLPYSSPSSFLRFLEDEPRFPPPPHSLLPPPIGQFG